MKILIKMFICCITVFVTACDKEDTSIQIATNTEYNGPEFDLLETPVGSVNFPVECHSEASPLVVRGVALLHNMMYEEASLVFSMADDSDPGCAMAYWGQAMALIHPLWPDRPTPEVLKRGSELIEKSISIGGHSEWENVYLKTTQAYFENGASMTEPERLKKFETAWRNVTRKYPYDLEARAFYALSLIATAGRGGQIVEQLEQAGRIAESVLEENDKHPGAHHYIIHSYDRPELASKAHKVADSYGTITPNVPHATHMMTHTYTRLGEWDKAIEWNRVSADTALAICVSTGEVNMHYTHALDYLAYAYLQIAADEEAENILKEADILKAPYSETNLSGSAHAFAALPARFALEKRDWQAAASLTPRMPADFPWSSEHDPYVAITHYARAIGMARSGNWEQAEAEIDAIHDIHVTLEDDRPYWALQVQIQEETIMALVQYMSGDKEGGLENMRLASILELSTEKSGVTPGEVQPTTELYGELLLEMEKYEDAQEAYNQSLFRTPGRLNSLFGAAKAAKALGQHGLAKEYLMQIIANAGLDNTGRPTIREARTMLEEI